MGLVYFTDRDLGQQFPDILQAAGIEVERHRDHFADDELDEKWIAAVAKRGWIAITHDKAISRRPNERDAVLGAGEQLHFEPVRIALTTGVHSHVVDGRARRHPCGWNVGAR